MSTPLCKTTAHRFATAAATLALCSLVVGCFGPRYARETYFENRNTTITLRGRTDINPGYDHPATISAVRLSHILASLDVRFEDDGKKNSRTAVVPIETIYPLGELIAGALTKANETQEVVVEAMVKSRKLKVFTENTLTAFTVYMKNDQLVFHIGRVGFTMPKNPKERVHEPKPGHVYQDFKVLRSRSITPIAQQALAVDWRDSYFRKADAIRLGPGGSMKRRMVLLEEPQDLTPEEETGDPNAIQVDLSKLSPEALRELADLEEERQRGAIGEAEYIARRRKILGTP